MGRIGRELARMARGFGMEVHYRDQQRLPPALELGAVFHGEDASFLAACDVLSLHAPGGARGLGTGWMRGDRDAAAGAVVANAARGTLIDDGALVAALQSGQSRRRGWTSITTSRRLMRGIGGWRTWCCCRIWAVRRRRLGWRWGCWCWTGSMRFWRVVGRGTRWGRVCAGGLFGDDGDARRAGAGSGPTQWSAMGQRRRGRGRGAWLGPKGG